MKIYDPRKPIPYIPVADRGRKNPTTFMVRPMTAPEYDAVMANVRSENPDHAAINRSILDTNLTGWRNLRDQDGGEIEYPKEGQSSALLPPTLRVELVKEIMRISDIDKDELKNCKPPESSEPDSGGSRAKVVPEPGRTS